VSDVLAGSSDVEHILLGSKRTGTPRIDLTSVLARYGRAAATGLLGTTLMSVAASLPGSPFAFKVPGAWFFGVPGSSQGVGITHSSGLMLLLELAGGFAGIGLLCRSWLSIHRGLSGGAEAHSGILAIILATWSMPLLIAPPMFSNDIYSYAAQGEMVSHHISPYVYGPGVLGSSPFSALAQGVWINTPSPYGPFFNGIDGDIVRIADHRVLFSVVILRLLAVLGVILMAVFLPRLARDYGGNPSTAFSLGILNPLVLLFLISSGHNDALMIGLLMAGLSLGRRGHFTTGIILCSLAGAIKVPGLIGVFAIAWTFDGTTPLWRRCRSVAKGCAVAAATLELLSVLSGLGWGWVHTLGASDSVTTWITPADLVAKVVPYIHVSAVSFLDVAHAVGPAIAIAVSLWALKRLPGLGLPRAMGLALMTAVLLGPIVQPWYLLWSIPILSVTAGVRTGTAIKVISVGACLLGAIGLGQLMGELTSLGLLYELLFVLILAASIVVPVESASQSVRRTCFFGRYISRWRPSPTLEIRSA
jgi:alpha-1,6-mannosyltransferase